MFTKGTANSSPDGTKMLTRACMASASDSCAFLISKKAAFLFDNLAYQGVSSTHFLQKEGEVLAKDLISILDLQQVEIEKLLESAARLKEMQKRGMVYRPLVGKTMALLFEKPSTRTRLSFQAGMHQLGGDSIFLSPQHTQLSRGETVEDTARTVSCFADVAVLRTFSHQTLENFAANADIPTINGLTDLLHPCQILADLLTIQEVFGDSRSRVVAFVGDGNNVAHSWINLAARWPIEVRVITPPGYEPSVSIVEEARRQGGHVVVTHDVEAVAGAHVVYTDVWASMGQEGEHQERVNAFNGYGVTMALMEMAGTDAVFMHCLPAHRGEEVSAEVIDGPRSVVWQEAENRMHMQKAIVIKLMGGEEDVV